MGAVHYLLACALLCAGVHYVRAQDCRLDAALADKPFPSLFNQSQLSYELSVEFKPKLLAQNDFIKEYYDIENNIGRVDMHSAGKSTRYYYNVNANEAFIVSGSKCENMNIDGIPDYMKDGVTDWLYKRDGESEVHGPSAMLLSGLYSSNNDKENFGYMGISNDTVRGLQSQYWRRCGDNMMTDYFFTTDDHEDAYGFDNLKAVPLRVEFSQLKEDSQSDFFPQGYDIISFKPFISDASVLEIPTGIGCVPKEDDEDPKMPDFSDKHIFTFGEVLYKNRINKDEIWSYYSTFMFGLDLYSNHLAYSYTPWGSINKDKEQVPDGLAYHIYDMKNKYLYKKDLAADTCTISRLRSYTPTYNLPNYGGTVDLTGPYVLFPNSEFQYISVGKDRGLNVHIYEADVENFSLGNRTVSKATITRKYLMDYVEVENTVGVKNALTSIQIKLYESDGNSNIITINFYGFTTNLGFKDFLFNIESCFKNDDDYLWVTMGFAIDPKIIDKIKTHVPSIKQNILNDITRKTELNFLRLPRTLVDFRDMLYVTIMVLDKPPIFLDYDEPIEGKSIATTEAEGIISVNGCGVTCLESEDNCWGFSYCGATCYYGTKSTDTIVDRKGCKFYSRFNNESFIPSKENSADNLRKLVKSNEMQLVVTYVSNGDSQMLTLEASYFEQMSAGETDELFTLMGKETNPRLRVVAVGSKLDKSTGSPVKNFGKLRYDECQRLCLDYKSCETVSYCLSDSSCVLSEKYGEDIPADKIIKDAFCNLLSRKFTDQFTRASGIVLSANARKVVDLRDSDDCAKACVKETSFQCLSFDHCPASKDKSCRLHDVHFLDIKSNDKATEKETVCGHYSKKYSYGFKRELETRSVGTWLVASTGITLEECARICVEYNKGTCYGYDFCEDKAITTSSCIILDKNPADFQTAHSPVCNHYVQQNVAASVSYTSGKAAWVGILTFLIAAVAGVLLTFGLAYYKANKAA